MNRQDQYLSNRVNGISIEYVEDPHPGFKGAGPLAKTHPQVAAQW
jgi:hypothetical protein